MFLMIPYWTLIVIIIAAWVFHIVMSVPPKSASIFHWETIKKLLVAQANRLFYILFYLLAAWIGNNLFVLGYSLSFVVWIVRVLAAYTAIKQLLFFVIGLFSIREKGDGRVTLSNLILAVIFALVALSV